MWIYWKYLFISAARWESQAWEKPQTTWLPQKGIWDVNIHFQFLSSLCKHQSLLGSFVLILESEKSQPAKVTLNLIPPREATFNWDFLLLGENLIENLCSWELSLTGEGKSFCLCRFFCCSTREVHLEAQTPKRAEELSWEGSEFLGKPCLESRGAGRKQGCALCK